MIWLTREQLIEIGVSRGTLHRERGNWKWRPTGTRGRNGKMIDEVLLESMPAKWHAAWMAKGRAGETPAVRSIESVASGAAVGFDERAGMANVEADLMESLVRYRPEARDALLREASRLGRIVERYDSIKPKRRRVADSATGGRDAHAPVHEFVPEVLQLCDEARCSDPTVLAIEPKRSGAVSPHTLEAWSKRYRQEGLATFLRKPAKGGTQNDQRRAVISVEAAEWIERNWRKYASPKKLHQAWNREAAKHGWTISSYGWVYRRYQELPTVVSTLIFEGQKKYTDRLAPFVPRTVADIDALQILCGDHSVRDVTVILPDGSLARPWLTLWLCLRTYLIWGWHLDLVPSATTISLAYANGVQTFGAQPIYPASSGERSELYIDQGRDYRSKAISGQLISYGKAAEIDTGLQTICHQHRVGLIDELGLRQRLARAYNAREKPVERVHADISRWEQAEFRDEYVGKGTENRPERWRDAYARHEKLRKRVGKNIEWLIAESPFMTLDSYRDNLAGWIAQEHNAGEHTRTVLNGTKMIPIREYERLYTTRYEIDDGTLALLLMKTTTRKLGKNGVNLFQQGWWYLHEAMAAFKGDDIKVEVRYSDADYSRVWVVLPNKQIVEAQLVQQSSIVRPNKQTIETVARQRHTERNLARDYQLLQQSEWRGESVEERLVASGQLAEAAGGEEREEQRMAVNDRPVVHAFHRFDAQQVSRPAPVTADDIDRANVIEGMFGREREETRIKEEWEY